MQKLRLALFGCFYTETKIGWLSFIPSGEMASFWYLYAKELLTCFLSLAFLFCQQRDCDDGGDNLRPALVKPDEDGLTVSHQPTWCTCTPSISMD